jgi:hypothetical protein
MYATGMEHLRALIRIFGVILLQTLRIGFELVKAKKPKQKK